MKSLNFYHSLPQFSIYTFNIAHSLQIMVKALKTPAMCVHCQDEFSRKKAELLRSKFNPKVIIKLRKRHSLHTNLI